MLYKYGKGFREIFVLQYAMKLKDFNPMEVSNHSDLELNYYLKHNRFIRPAEIASITSTLLERQKPPIPSIKSDCKVCEETNRNMSTVLLNTQDELTGLRDSIKLSKIANWVNFGIALVLGWFLRRWNNKKLEDPGNVDEYDRLINNGNYALVLVVAALALIF